MKKFWTHYSYAIVLIFLSIVSAFILSIRFDAFHQNHYLKVTIYEGDTLLKIADKYSSTDTPSGEAFVQWVQRHNNIDADHILPGEKIIIPVKSETKPLNEFASAAND